MIDERGLFHMYNKREMGSKQEEIAMNYLIDNGYKILDKNFFTKSGEIDIIAKHENYLAFIEVKYRTNVNMGLPQEAVDYRKIKRISKTALYYIYKNKISSDIPCRFDVIVILDKEITLIKNAFDMIY